MIRFADLKGEMLTNPEVAAEYERLGPVYELVGATVEARHAAGLTEGELPARLSASSRSPRRRPGSRS